MRLVIIGGSMAGLMGAMVRFDFFFEAQRGVVTAHRWSQKSIDRLARNCCWGDWLP